MTQAWSWNQAWGFGLRKEKGGGRGFSESRGCAGTVQSALHLLAHLPVPPTLDHCHLLTPRQKKKPKLRNVKRLVQGHTPRKCWSWDRSPDVTPNPAPSTMPLSRSQLRVPSFPHSCLKGLWREEMSLSSKEARIPVGMGVSPTQAQGEATPHFGVAPTVSLAQETRS